MPFELSEEQELIRRTAREFAEQRLAEAELRADREASFPAEAKGLAELGLLGLLAPVEHGGAGLDAVCLAVTVEELARRSGGVACAALAHNVAAKGLAASPQGAEWLPRLAAGEAMGTLCLAPGPQGLSLRGAEKLSGTARPFPLAGQAAVGLLPHPQGGLALAARGGAGQRWLPEASMGLRSAAPGALVLRDAALPRVDAEPWALLDVGLAALAVGLGQAAVEESARFAKDRVQFHKPIATFEGVRGRLADMAIGVDAARALTLQAAARQDGTPRGRRLAAEAKVQATEAASAATRLGVKLLGGAGFLKDFPLERLNRDARMLPLLGGGSAQQRDLLARILLE